MVDLAIDKRLADRLEALAREENRPLNRVLEDMLEHYSASSKQTPGVTNWAAEMARMADEETDNNWDNFAPDLSARSREILEEEFAEYLLSRQQTPKHDE